ncbi:MAG: DUF4390 domain-containing protein [Burkholderiaceae bacterium]|nr:DUF4390 domain-containing protein [Burkholderiaceae bacterium]
MLQPAPLALSPAPFPQAGEEKESRSLVTRLLLSLLLFLAVATGAWAAPGAVELSELQVMPEGDGLYLSAQMHLAPGPMVEQALDKGIPIHFVADAQIVRERWYWFDGKIADEKRYFRLAFQPLTRRWRVNVSSQPILDSGLGVSYSQYYDSLDEAMRAIGRIARWRIADAAELASSARQTLRFHFRLDTRQLPRALQAGTSGQSGWTMEVERRIDLTSEAAK